jgi:hypothetical protein
MRIKIEDKEFEVDIEAAKRLGLAKEVPTLVAGQVWKRKGAGAEGQVLIVQPIYDNDDLFSVISLNVRPFKTYSDPIFKEPSTVEGFMGVKFFENYRLIGVIKSNFLEPVIKPI